MYQDIGAIPFLRQRPSVAGDVLAIPKPQRRGRTRVKVHASSIEARGTAGFVAWLKRDFPQAYAALANKRPDLLRNGAGLGQTEKASRGQQIADFVMPLLQVYQQRQILKLQLERAKKGQPPVDVEAYAAPATRVEVEAGAKTQRTGLLIAGAVGLGAVAFLASRRRPR